MELTTNKCSKVKHLDGYECVFGVGGERDREREIEREKERERREIT